MSGRHRKPRNRAPGRHRRPPGPARWVAPGVVVIALLGAGGVGAHAALSNSDSGAPSMPTTYPENVSPSIGAVPGVSPTPTPSPSPSAAASAPAAAHHRVVALRLDVGPGISWIEVRRPGGRVLVSGIVRHGRHLSYAHGPLDVTIGNAGAVRITRHGDTRRAGKPGAVVHLRVP
jgi:hypothetical protein